MTIHDGHFAYLSALARPPPRDPAGLWLESKDALAPLFDVIAVPVLLLSILAAIGLAIATRTFQRRIRVTITSYAVIGASNASSARRRSSASALNASPARSEHCR